MKIGMKIQAQRKAAGLTQAELAERLRVSFQTVSGWERDEYLPDTKRLSDIAEALGVSAGALLDGQDGSGEGWLLRDRLFSEEHMHTFVKASAAAKGYHQTHRALSFAAEKHEGQFRKGPGQVPYISHPLTMACHALAMGLGDDVVAALLLHDVCEDCGVQPDELPAGEAVRRAVRLVSFSVGPGETRTEAKARYFAGISEDAVACMVKLIDRCNNLSMMAAGFTREKMIEYIHETERCILPLIDTVKDRLPEYYDAAFLLKYQMLSIVETLKRTIG